MKTFCFTTAGGTTFNTQSMYTRQCREIAIIKCACETEAYAEDKARDEEEAYHENSLHNMARSKPNDNALEPFELTINLCANHSLKRVGDIILVEPSESVTKAKAIARVKQIDKVIKFPKISDSCLYTATGGRNELVNLFGITEEELN